MATGPNRQTLLLTLSLLLLATGVSAQTASRVPATDVQNWNDVQLTVPVNKSVDFVMQGALRAGDNLTEAVDERLGAGFNFKLNPHITLQQSIFGRVARTAPGRNEHETRLTFGVTLQKLIGKFGLSDRNWFERRWRDPQIDAWRYRNRVRLEHAFQIKKTAFTWFVSDEVFYDWTLQDWVRNRAAVGIARTFNKQFALDVYYMRQNDGRARPGDLHIIGTVWRIKL